ncbi:MAG: DUF1800 domain-containing protein [Phototrophicaceae bacterium]
MNRRKFIRLWGSASVALPMERVAGVLLANRHLLQPIPMRDPMFHAVSRLSYGMTPALYQQLQSTDIDAYLQEQLTPQAIDDSALERQLLAFPLLDAPPYQLLDSATSRRDMVVNLFGGVVNRAWFSKRQLYERMVQFWGDHFSIFASDKRLLALKIVDDRETIRPYAFSTFIELLRATAHSPAMLVYLDNATSSKEAPNENYARELLELHTLGINGGYTEADIKEIAKAFTGWSLHGQDGDATLWGTFYFREGRYAPGTKNVLGYQINVGGEQDGEAVLDIVATHPSTARFICHKLARHFVADVPPDSLITKLTANFWANNGSIPQLMQTLITADEFWTAPPKFKRPFEFVIGMLRTLDYYVKQPIALQNALYQTLSEMGHVPFQWATPDGYPDEGAYWINNLLPRWNATLKLLQATDVGEPRWETLYTLGEGQSLGLPVPYLLGRSLTTDETTLISDFMKSVGGSADRQFQAAVALLLASPAYQYQ